jgi:hypothetical protein
VLAFASSLFALARISSLHAAPKYRIEVSVVGWTLTNQRLVLINLGIS